jgi:LacI family transcriptional regulator
MPERSNDAKSKRPSMNDVAHLAGVSQTTVSFVVNQVEGANIPPETQQKVQAAIKELGYRPNAIARGLRSNRTHTIGFISDEVATTPYAGQMIQGAQEAGWQHENLLLLVNIGSNAEMEQAAVEMLLDRQVEGIIYAAMFHRPASPPAIIREVPTVLLDCFMADRSLPSVVPDEVQGGFTATETLIQAGHRRIAFLNNSDDIPATHGRLAGYQQALAAYNLPFDPALIRKSAAKGMSNYESYAATLSLLEEPEPPSAIFCFNDRMAMDTYYALRHLGLSIPADIAVIGFDNQEIIAASLRPGLTTVALPHYQMGQWAVEHLLTLINHPKSTPLPAPEQYTMPCPLIERSSI